MSNPHHDLAQEISSAVIKTIPPVAVWTFTLNNVLAALSIVYVLAQTVHLLWVWRVEWLKRSVVDEDGLP